MKILVAPDKFKGSLTSSSAALAIEAGIKAVLPNAQIALAPIADGGEGTVEAVVSARKGIIKTARVIGPMGDTIEASFGMFAESDGTAVGIIEMCAASGMGQMKGKTNPLGATTFGTGELILAALDQGAEKIIVGLGGSATTDGGAGMAQALGVRLIDNSGKSLERGGGALAQLAKIDASGLDRRIKKTKMCVACDVDSPLYGESGAARVFAVQKGARPQEVQILEQGLRNLAKIIETDMAMSVAKLPGAGAAGGLGAGLAAFTGARLKSGFALVSDMIGLKDRMAGVDLVITGEGQIDSQSMQGKAPIGVARLAKSLGIPAIAIVGCVGQGADAAYDHGISAYLPIAIGPATVESMSKDAGLLVEKAAARAARLIEIGKFIKTQSGK